MNNNTKKVCCKSYNGLEERWLIDIEEEARRASSLKISGYCSRAFLVACSMSLFDALCWNGISIIR